MYTEDLARYRIDDMVREAEAFRKTRDSRAGRAAERRTRARRMATVLASVVLWPIRH